MMLLLIPGDWLADMTDDLDSADCYYPVSQLRRDYSVFV